LVKGVEAVAIHGGKSMYLMYHDICDVAETVQKQTKLVLYRNGLFS